MGSGPLWDFHAPPAFLCGILMPVLGSKILMKHCVCKGDFKDTLVRFRDWITRVV